MMLVFQFMAVTGAVTFGATQGPYKTTHATVVNPGQDKSNQNVDVVCVVLLYAASCVSCLLSSPSYILCSFPAMFSCGVVNELPCVLLYSNGVRATIDPRQIQGALSKQH